MGVGLLTKTLLKGGAYGKEGAKSNHYGNHGFGGHLDEKVTAL